MKIKHFKEFEKEDKGFTLIELIIVVVIISVIATIAIPLYNNFQDSARQAAVESSAVSGLSLASYEQQNGWEELRDAFDDLNAEDRAVSLYWGINPSSQFIEREPCVIAHYDGYDNFAAEGNCRTQLISNDLGDDNDSDVFAGKVFERDGEEYSYCSFNDAATIDIYTSIENSPSMLAMCFPQ